MKILLVNDYAVQQGGAEIMLINLRDALRRRGHDARLLASNAGEIEARNLADYTCLGTTSRFRTLLQTANPWAARRLRQVLAEFRPDVVHVQMFLTQLSPLILPALRNFPSLCHVVWYRPICPLGTKTLPDQTPCYSPPGLVCHRTGCLPWRDWFPLILQMKLWRHWRGVFDLVVANSDHVRNRLLAEGMGAVEVVLNGVAASQPRSALPSLPTIAFAGRLVREKGVDVLLRAFAIVRQQLPQARLVICGDGPERGDITNLAGSLGLAGSVSMTGFRASEEVQNVFRESWLVAVPSIWQEPFGHVAIEAMMNGVAVVASDTGGLRESVRDGETGFLCRPGDAESFAAALLRILSDGNLAERLGRAGYKRASSEFSEARLVEQFLALYGSIRRKEGR